MSPKSPRIVDDMYIIYTLNLQYVYIYIYIVFDITEYVCRYCTFTLILQVSLLVHVHNFLNHDRSSFYTAAE